jgi:hypothetical protein
LFFIHGRNNHVEVLIFSLFHGAYQSCPIMRAVPARKEAAAGGAGGGGGVEVVRRAGMPAAAEEVEVVLEGLVEDRVPVGRVVDQGQAVDLEAVDQGLPGVRAVGQELVLPAGRAVGQDQGLPGDQGNRRKTAANRKTNAEETANPDEPTAEGVGPALRSPDGRGSGGFDFKEAPEGRVKDAALFDIIKFA